MKSGNPTWGIMSIIDEHCIGPLCNKNSLYWGTNAHSVIIGPILWNRFGRVEGNVYQELYATTKTYKVVIYW